MKNWGGLPGFKRLWASYRLDIGHALTAERWYPRQMPSVRSVGAPFMRWEVEKK